MNNGECWLWNLRGLGLQRISKYLYMGAMGTRGPSCRMPVSEIINTTKYQICIYKHTYLHSASQITHNARTAPMSELLHHRKYATKFNSRSFECLHTPTYVSISLAKPSVIRVDPGNRRWIWPSLVGVAFGLAPWSKLSLCMALE